MTYIVIIKGTDKYDINNKKKTASRFLKIE